MGPGLEPASSKEPEGQMRGCLACAFRHVLKSMAVNDLEGLFLDWSGRLPGPVILESGCTLASTGEL